jgi:hypothetical protein
MKGRAGRSSRVMRAALATASLLPLLLLACWPEVQGPVVYPVVATVSGPAPVIVDPAPPMPVVKPPAPPPMINQDLPQARQLYCNGTCSWAGAQGCDQEDADVFCKLKTGRLDAVARTFQIVKALPEGGYTCPQPSYGQSLGAWKEAGIEDIRFQETSILANHGSGDVVTDVECNY